MLVADITLMFCATMFGLTQQSLDAVSTASPLFVAKAQNCSNQNCSNQNCSNQNCSNQNCSTQNCSTPCEQHGPSPCDNSCDRCDPAADEIWLVSCRGLPCLSSCEPQPAETLGDGLTYWRYDHDLGCWQKSAETGFQETDAANLPTIVWIHGSCAVDGEAFEHGWQFYREFVRCVDCNTPIRFIIWSWPSENSLALPAKTARLIASRIAPAAIRLAWQLDRLGPDQQISLIGFSYGARLAAGALHMLGGGQLAGHCLDIPADKHRQRFRVTWLAAALESYWLQPGQRFERALDCVDHLLLLNNYCDWVLKRYGKLYCRRWRRGPEALGYTGLALTSLMAAYRDRAEQFNAGVYIGRHHSWRPYAYTPALMQMIRNNALDAPAQETLSP